MNDHINEISGLIKVSLSPPLPEVADDKTEHGVDDAGKTTESEITELEQIKTSEELNKVSSTFSGLDIFSPRKKEFASHLNSGVKFSDPQLGIPSFLLEALEVMKKEYTSVVQKEAIPHILAGKNVVAQAQGGAGKTIAFAIGLLSRIDPSQEFPQALCIAPTREVSIQIAEETLAPLSEFMHPTVKISIAVGGVYPENPGLLSTQVVVGTAVGIRNWISRRHIDRSKVKILAVDEADMMLGEQSHKQQQGGAGNYGRSPDAGQSHAQDSSTTVEVKRMLSRECQVVLFSATYPTRLLPFINAVLGENNYIQILLRNRGELILKEIFQTRMDANAHPEGKLGILKSLYNTIAITQSIIFCERRIDCDNIAWQMNDAGYGVSVLHSGLSAIERDEVMAAFMEQRTRVLITTNVLARGVNVPAVKVVINYDLPVIHPGAYGGQFQPDPESYVHRICRTGRFGRRGIAISFCETMEDFENLDYIQRFHMEKSSSGDPEPFITEWDPNNIEELNEKLRELEQREDEYDDLVKVDDFTSGRAAI